MVVGCWRLDKRILVRAAAPLIGLPMTADERPTTFCSRKLKSNL